MQVLKLSDNYSEILSTPPVKEPVDNFEENEYNLYVK